MRAETEGAVRSADQTYTTPSQPQDVDLMTVATDPVGTSRHRELSRGECEERLVATSMGRVAWSTGRLQHILPVSYTMHAGNVVFRTSPYGALAQLERPTNVAFEIDQVDPIRENGWSVVVQGRAHAVVLAHELVSLWARPDLMPWAPGTRNLFISIEPRTPSAAASSKHPSLPQRPTPTRTHEPSALRPKEAFMNPHHSAGQNAVVVAIDESDSCRAALSWAATDARTVEAELRAVHVLRYDFGAPLGWTPGLRAATRAVSEPGIELTHAAIRTIFDSIGPEASWTLSFLEGPTGQEIVDYARDAQLFVVGTREHKGLDRLVVGSVSHYCLNHVVCPIVIVPPTKVPGRSRTRERGRVQRGAAVGMTSPQPRARWTRSASDRKAMRS